MKSSREMAENVLARRAACFVRRRKARRIVCAVLLLILVGGAVALLPFVSQKAPIPDLILVGRETTLQNTLFAFPSFSSEDTGESYFSEAAPATRTLSLLGKEFVLDYEFTSPATNEKTETDCYTFHKKTGGRVAFSRENGQLCSVVLPQDLVLNFTKKPSEETLFSTAEEFVKAHLTRSDYTRSISTTQVVNTKRITTDGFLPFSAAGGDEPVTEHLWTIRYSFSCEGYEAQDGIRFVVNGYGNLESITFINPGSLKPLEEKILPRDRLDSFAKETCRAALKDGASPDELEVADVSVGALDGDRLHYTVTLEASGRIGEERVSETILLHFFSEGQ